MPILRILSLVLACNLTTVCLGSPNPDCLVKAGLYEEWGNSEKQKAANKKYYEFLYAIAEATQKGDESKFHACADSAKSDPIASRLVAMVQYLHEGKKNPTAFIASLPQNERETSDFWSLDGILFEGGKSARLSLLGIQLPDGLVDKFLDELFSLVLGDSRAATEKYFYLYAHSNGEYAEFMDEQTKLLFEKHPDLVLRHWSVIRPCQKHLIGMSEDNPPEFSEKMVQMFKTRCDAKDEQKCREIVRIFQ